MKKVFLVAAVLVAGFASQAQVSFGVKAGATLYQFGGEDGKDLESQSIKPGFYAGGLVNIKVSDMFSVQPELIFSNQGALQKEDDAKLIWNLSYVNLPVMFQYNNPSGFYAELGPEVGFLATAKIKAKIDDEDETEDVKDQFKSINFSVGVGAGYELANGFGFGARYNFGLANIIDQDDVDVKNSGFHIGVFYKFGKKAAK